MKNDPMTAGLITCPVYRPVPAGRASLGRVMARLSLSAFAVALVLLPAQGHAQRSRLEMCAMLGAFGHQIAELRDSGLPREAVKAQAETLSVRDADRSSLRVFREFVDLIYDHPAVEPGFIEGSLAAACMASE